MIDRENLKYYENILSLENDNIDLTHAYAIMTAIKENDYRNIVDIVLSNLNADISNVKEVQNILDPLLFAIKENDEQRFYTTLLNSTSNYNLNLLGNVLAACRNNPKLANNILDSFSDNQLNAKNQLLGSVSQFLQKSRELEVIIFGSWYGSILIPRLKEYAKRISCIDLDEQVLKIAKNHLFQNLSNIEHMQADVFEKCLSRYKDTDLIINTSCEHMLPMQDWPFWNEVNKHAIFALQSNNMYGIEGHINCVDSIEEFKKQMPGNFNVLNENEMEEERGTRFTLVGCIN